MRWWYSYSYIKVIPVGITLNCIKLCFFAGKLCTVKLVGMIDNLKKKKKELSKGVGNARCMRASVVCWLLVCIYLCIYENVPRGVSPRALFVTKLPAWVACG